MSKKVTDPVEEPEINAGEESDEYDDIEDEDGELGAEVEEEDGEHEGDDAELTTKGESLTAMLLGGAEEDDEDEEDDDDSTDEDEDDEYAPDIKGPGTAAIGSAPTPSVGTKRSRDEEEVDDAEDVSGDYGEFEENGETAKKKARATVEDEA